MRRFPSFGISEKTRRCGATTFNRCASKKHERDEQQRRSQEREYREQQISDNQDCRAESEGLWLPSAKVRRGSNRVQDNNAECEDNRRAEDNAEETESSQALIVRAVGSVFTSQMANTTRNASDRRDPT